MPDPTAWHVEITHPETGRILVPDVLDDPEINPSLNSLPRIRIPVPKSDQWLDPALEGDPDMAVWREGDRQPIDELREVEERTDRTVLVGVGGVQLERRVSREYQSEERHLAARELITSETDYVEDVDDPVVTRIEDQPQQSAETTAEFEAITDIANTEPIKTSGGTYSLAQTCFTKDGWGEFSSSNGTFTNGPDYSGSSPDPGNGSAVRLENNESAEYQFYIEHTIPEGEVGAWFRQENSGGGTPGTEWKLNGSTVDTLDGSTDIERLILSWRDVASGVFNGPGWSGGDLKPADNPHTLRVETDGTGSGNLNVDHVALVDNRYEYNFDNSVTTVDGDNYLDGPEHYPTATTSFIDSESPFSIVGGRATTTFNDTSGSQRIQLSNDRGTSYLPDDGSEQNTETIAVDPFPDPGSALRFRTTLDRYSPDGARDETPRFGYASQAIQSLETFADIEQQLLLVDERYDDTLENVLNDIATDIEYVWSYRIVDGTPTVSWTQPGQRVADRDPDLGDVTVNKDATTFQKVSVKGSNQRASGEPFEASSTFQQLVRNDILTGSEVVYDTDTGQNFERDSDYEIRYGDGEIRAVDGGDLTIGTSYRIDYEYEIEGTIDLSDDATEPRERVENVPGVTSVRQAEQVAFLFASEFSDARYSADLTVPRSEVTFNAIEALSLSNLNLPDAATPLEVRGEPQITPRGLQLRLGSGGEIADLSAQISRQVRRLSRRS